MPEGWVCPVNVPERREDREQNRPEIPESLGSQVPPDGQALEELTEHVSARGSVGVPVGFGDGEPFEAAHDGVFGRHVVVRVFDRHTGAAATCFVHVPVGALADLDVRVEFFGRVRVFIGQDVADVHRLV